jgi:Flp pilus assembly protein TadG
MRPCSIKRGSQKGHAMLELAISAGVMVTCLGGTFQFGYTFYVYNELVSAVGNGARYASVQPASEDVESDKTAIRNMVVYGESLPSPSALPSVRNLKPEQVSVEYVQDGAAVRVAIQGYKVDAVFGEFEFSGRPGVEFPVIGRAK